VPSPAHRRFFPLAAWLLCLACLLAAPSRAGAMMTPPAKLASWGFDVPSPGRLSHEPPANQDGIRLGEPCAYESASGRLSFLSADPLGHGASMSLYDYCGGDPVNGLDPTGRCSQDNSGGNPGLMIYTNNWDTYSRYTGSQRNDGQMGKANVTYVASPDSINNVFLDTALPSGASPTFGAATYQNRVTINQNESWYYYDAGDAENKAVGRAMLQIFSTAAPRLVGFSPTAAEPLLSAFGNGAARNITAGTAQNLIKVTSWASDGIVPDLNPGRWVQLGDATLWNFWKTGLPGPKGYLQRSPPFLKLEESTVPFSNSITGEVPANSLQWPSGLDKWRGIFGQRQIKPE